MKLVHSLLWLVLGVLRVDSLCFKLNALLLLTPKDPEWNSGVHLLTRCEVKLRVPGLVVPSARRLTCLTKSNGWLVLLGNLFSL